MRLLCRLVQLLQSLNGEQLECRAQVTLALGTERNGMERKESVPAVPAVPAVCVCVCCVKAQPSAV